VETANLTTVIKNYKINLTETCESIKLGIDAHAKWYYVARQLDGATPQPVQKMDFEGLLHFVARQKRMAREVHTCYEAGAFGYHLHHQLAALGVTNYVVQPQDWDERGKGVKNDRIDALALCQRLDRYVRGNRKAFSVVRVPTAEEERERAISRQRQQLVRERQRLQAMGRSLLAMHGIHVSGKWWQGKTWSKIRSEAPEWVIERLEVFSRLIAPLEAESAKLTSEIEEAAADQKIPKGVGPLTFEVLRREVGDWSRFTNRRQVSSYTGLCPREHSSGGKRRSGSVSKSGNPRVRAMLVEMVWRMTLATGLSRIAEVAAGARRSGARRHARRRWLPSPGNSPWTCGGCSPGKPPWRTSASFTCLMPHDADQSQPHIHLLPTMNH